MQLLLYVVSVRHVDFFENDNLEFGSRSVKGKVTETKRHVMPRVLQTFRQNGTLTAVCSQIANHIVINVTLQTT